MMLDDVRIKSTPVKVVEVIEEPRNIQAISPFKCLQTPKQPEKLQTPAKALKSKIA